MPHGHSTFTKPAAWGTGDRSGDPFGESPAAFASACHARRWDPASIPGELSVLFGGHGGRCLRPSLHEFPASHVREEGRDASEDRELPRSGALLAGRSKAFPDSQEAERPGGRHIAVAAGFAGPQEEASTRMPSSLAARRRLDAIGWLNRLRELGPARKLGVRRVPVATRADAMLLAMNWMLRATPILQWTQAREVVTR